MHSYFLNFPQQNQERENPNILLPVLKEKIHQNSIFDIAWLADKNSVVTASGDHESLVHDLEKNRTSLVLPEIHEASIKCVTCLESNPSIVITGGRDSKIAVYDIRQRQLAQQLSTHEPECKLLAWRNASTQ